jgi:galactoside 2-L-fucosyltransferase 1/2
VLAVFASVNTTCESKATTPFTESWRYFSGISDTVLQAFELKDKYQSQVDNYLQIHQLLTQTRIAIHVRRGDLYRWKVPYLLFPPARYFIAMMAFFRAAYGPEVTFMIVSTKEGVDWARKEKYFQENPHMHYVQGGNAPAVDMGLLASADHVVTTMGTFGWWGAWLSQKPAFHYSSEFNFESEKNNKIAPAMVQSDYRCPGWLDELTADPSNAKIILDRAAVDLQGCYRPAWRKQ